MTKKFIIALGGSIICPKDINTNFLRKFSLFIKKEVKKGNKFIIVIGGGNISRIYQEAASKITKLSDENKDWLGIHATRLNARLLKIIFKQEANPMIFDQQFKIKSFGKFSIIIGSGWKPGWSTDFVTTQIAVDYGINEVIILGKPDHVYTADPRKDKTAQPIEEISWSDYQKLIPKKWIPGMHAPVDPVAAALAKKKKLKVIVANATDLNNLEKILKQEKFIGTTLY
ncbi:UMP kinase [Candidatus Parcubacteria bacterium]|nr:UMP kinase [Candidatus Parcubacteria bacterium]